METQQKTEEFQLYFKKMKEIQKLLLSFLEDEKEITTEAKYSKLIEFIDQYQLDDHEFKSLLNLIVKISDNHFRNPNFYNKIFRILLNYKEKIKQFFSNLRMFYFFMDNKQIILFLIKEKIMIIDEDVAENIINNQYLSCFFYPEIKSFPSCKIEISENDSIEFEEKRKVGENTEYICQLIRNDDLDGFIVYINKNGIQLDSQINNSIFETNQFLLENQPSLIEYSAFFGSIKIFNYLYLNNVELTPSLWIYGIHGNNPEIISFLEEQKVDFFEEQKDDFLVLKKNKGVYNCLKESIKCHHNEIANYFINNMININSRDFNENIADYSLCYHNYHYIPNDLNNYTIFNLACKYDHYIIVEFYILSNKNKKIVKPGIFI